VRPSAGNILEVCRQSVNGIVAPAVAGAFLFGIGEAMIDRKKSGFGFGGSISDLIGMHDFAGSASGGDQTLVRRTSWPRCSATSNHGAKSACGRMDVGEQHSGLKDGVPYTIRRIR